MGKLGERLERYGLSAKKSWGQNFLSDPGILNYFISAIEQPPPSELIELGAGPGILTELLAEYGYKVFAVERDEGFITLLEGEFASNPNVTVIAGDAKKINVTEICSQQPVTVVGNLPYNIASMIIFNLLEQRDCVSQLVFTLQFEMAQRIISKPRSKEYSALSVFLQIFGEPRMVKKIPAKAFIPAPKVDSAIVSIKIKRALQITRAEEEILFDIINASFRMRRKKLKNALEPLFEEYQLNSSSLFLSCGISADSRAEELAPEIFLEMAKKVHQMLR